MNNLLKLINALAKHLKDEISIRQLSKETKVPYTTTYMEINKNKALFSINKKGNIRFVSLKLQDEIIKNYIVISERLELERFLRKNNKFNTLRNELPAGSYAVVLFGSRAAGRERKKSDIDLCIINKDGKKNVSFSKFELLFKVEVNPVFFSREEFRKMLRDKESDLAKEIMKNHLIILGEEYFWEVVWDAI